MDLAKSSVPLSFGSDHLREALPMLNGERELAPKSLLTQVTLTTIVDPLDSGDDALDLVSSVDPKGIGSSVCMARATEIAPRLSQASTTVGEAIDSLCGGSNAGPLPNGVLFPESP